MESGWTHQIYAFHFPPYVPFIPARSRILRTLSTPTTYVAGGKMQWIHLMGSSCEHFHFANHILVIAGEATCIAIDEFFKLKHAPHSWGNMVCVNSKSVNTSQDVSTLIAIAIQCLSVSLFEWCRFISDTVFTCQLWLRPPNICYDLWVNICTIQSDLFRPIEWARSGLSRIFRFPVIMVFSYERFLLSFPIFFKMLRKLFCIGLWTNMKTWKTWNFSTFSENLNFKSF